MATATYQKAIAKSADTFTGAEAVPGSSCVQCIGGGGVWCSRTYAYLETTAGVSPSLTQNDYMY